MAKSLKNKKIFHGFINYGTQAGYHSKGLRNLGYYACSYSTYDLYKRPIDYRLKYGKSFFGKFYTLIHRFLIKSYVFYKYDIFHFYFGKSFIRNNADLPYLKFFGKKVVFHYLGKDVLSFTDSASNNKYSNIKLQYSEEEGRKRDAYIEWKKKRRKKYADAEIVCAPLYAKYVPGSTVVPLGIDLSRYKYSYKVPGEKIIILHAPTNRLYKGTSFLESAVEKLQRDGKNVTLEICEKMSHEKLLQRIAECDIFVDHLLGAWYGTVAVEALAIGKPTICIMDESLFQYIDYGPKIPIVNANPDTIYSVLESLINRSSEWQKLSQDGRSFVEEIHDYNKTSEKIVEIYQSVF